MESFYGGRQGASFVIKKSFKYIDFEDPAWKADRAAWEADPDNNEEPTEWHIMFRCLNDPTYHDVWYNEYCIIDTTNKNNPNNGKIFRRVLPTEGNSNLPYEEIGTIVGPSSGAAMLKPQSGLIKFGDIRAELEHKWDGLGISDKIQETNSFGHLVYEDINKNKIYVNANGKFMNGETGEEFQEDDPNRPQVEIKDLTPVFVTNEDGTDKKGPVLYDPSFSANSNIVQSQWPDNVELETYKVEIDKGLVHAINPKEENIVVKETIIDEEDGKTKVKTSYDSKKIVNDIKYNWFNVRKNTEGDDGVVESWCYIGFEIPAPSFTVEALYKTPGTKPEVYLTDNAKDFAFWHDIHFDIPGGIRGISIEKIFTNDTHRKNVDDSDQIFVQRAWSFDNIHYDTKTDTYSLKGKDAQGNTVTEDITYNSKGPSTISDKLKEPYSTKSLFCNLRIINPKDNAEDEDWPIVLENLTFFIGVIEEIEYVKFNTDTGHLQIAYHNQDDDTWDLRYPKQITFTTAKDTIQTDGSEKEIEYNTGYYDIDYSCGDDESGHFGFVRKIVLKEGEGEDTTNGSLTFVNSIDNQTQTFKFHYPQDMELDSHTGIWKIDYFGAADKTGQFIYPRTLEIDQKTGEYDITYSNDSVDSGQFGFVDKATISDTNGTITFHNTVTGDDVQDLIYVKDIDANAETGVLTATYSNSITEDFVQFVYPKTMQMDVEGNVTYVNSASETIDMGQLVFVDDVVVDNAHQLLIAYTDNSQIETTANGTVELNGKTYINYGQTIGKLGVISGPMPTGVVDKATIDNIIAWYNTTYTQGMIDGEVSGKLHVVTTEPIDGTDSISYFVMWDPDAKIWYQVSEIAGAPVGIPAQIGGVLEIGENESWSYSDSENSLADGVVRFVQLTENEEPLMVSFPWM